MVFTCSELGFVLAHRYLHHRTECVSNIGICLHEKNLALLLNDDFVFEELHSRFPSEKLLLTVFHLIIGIFKFIFTVARLTHVIFGVIGFQDGQQVFHFRLLFDYCIVKL